MIPSQGGYLRGELPNVSKEKVENTVKDRIIHNFKDYVGKHPYYDNTYNLEKFADKQTIKFNFIHEYEK